MKDFLCEEDIQDNAESDEIFKDIVNIVNKILMIDDDNDDNNHPPAELKQSPDKTNEFSVFKETKSNIVNFIIFIVL